MYMMFTYTKKFSQILLFLFCLLASFSSQGIEIINRVAAQDANNTGLNETQKQLFQEARQISSKDKNTLTSILMIVAVLLIVALAMYLSFRKDDSENKRSFAVRLKKIFNYLNHIEFVKPCGFTFFLSSYGLYQTTTRFCITHRQAPTCNFH